MKQNIAVLLVIIVAGVFGMLDIWTQILEK